MEGNSSAGWTTATSEARPHGGIFRTPRAPFFSTVARVLVLSSLLSVDAQLSKYKIKDLKENAVRGCQLPSRFPTGLVGKVIKDCASVAVEADQCSGCAPGGHLIFGAECKVTCGYGFEEIEGTQGISVYGCHETMVTPTVRCREVDPLKLNSNCHPADHRLASGRCLGAPEGLGWGKNVTSGELFNVAGGWSTAVVPESAEKFLPCGVIEEDRSAATLLISEADHGNGATTGLLCYFRANREVLEVAKKLYGGSFRFRISVLYANSGFMPFLPSPGPGRSDIVIKNSANEIVLLNKVSNQRVQEVEVPFVAGEWVHLYNEQIVTVEELRRIMASMTELQIRASYWMGPETTELAFLQVVLPHLDKTDGWTKPKVMDHLQQAMNDTVAAKRGWKTLGLRLSGDKADFRKAHQNLFLEEVASWLRIDKEALPMQMVDIIASNIIIVQFAVPPAVEPEDLTHFELRVQSHEINFFSQFPVEIISVVNGRTTEPLVELLRTDTSDFSPKMTLLKALSKLHVIPDMYDKTAIDKSLLQTAEMLITITDRSTSALDLSVQNAVKVAQRVVAGEVGTVEEIESLRHMPKGKWSAEWGKFAPAT